VIANAIECLAVRQRGLRWSSVAAVTNTGPINYINIVNSSATGNVTNTNTGTITAVGNTAPTATGITINNSTIGGAIVNNGSITSKSGQARLS
jgi:hypothetical protein